MTEKASLVRLPDRWRAYVSCATPAVRTGGWACSRPARLEDLAHATVQPVLPGDPATTGLKDPVVRRPPAVRGLALRPRPDRPGEEDRMSTLHATSEDGMSWTVDPQPVLTGTPGRWDARGAR